ncbi:FAD-dependent oxidoreductase [Haloechinothrix sp. LS1_15]|uniref:FAD-dependent oxidoreductase n=1 Tax=Haloechinothrix sp. LS1_15 TaxID=2652248 RepID=UPI002947898E|nr:FAD-dependent oxidoreductase [Haloechinothrix sp. LS1_15]MDV6011638.1 NAD(P)/FAD-dependent oxidoreductase [Haloechinothrix sp. LS1_15]
MSDVVIVGYGPAAQYLVERLRHEGYGGEITVIDADGRAGYHRALLTSVLGGELEPEAITVPRAGPGVRLRPGVMVERIDTRRRLVHTRTTGTGTPERGTLGYGHLVLATGARPRVPAIPGLRAATGELASGVTTLRTLDDCLRVRGERVALLGAGVLGVESALALARRGCRVSLVHRHPYPMNRQLDPAAGELLADRLRECGIELLADRQAVAYRDGHLVLDGGTRVPAAFLVLCTGVVPVTDPARQAGLATRGGVLVDDRLRTSDPHISALGDCAEHASGMPAQLGPARDQAASLAAVLAGRHARYRGSRVLTRLKAREVDVACLGAGTAAVDPVAVPGCGAGGELVTLADRARRRYASMTLRDDRVAGAVLLGLPRAIATVTQLYDDRRPVPSDRLGVLLGTGTADTESTVDLPDDAVVCRCSVVTKRALIEAWHEGARTVPELAEATRATSGCGSCTDEVRRICEAQQGTDVAVARPPAGSAQQRHAGV